MIETDETTTKMYEMDKVEIKNVTSEEGNDQAMSQPSEQELNGGSIFQPNKELTADLILQPNPEFNRNIQRTIEIGEIGHTNEQEQKVTIFDEQKDDSISTTDESTTSTTSSTTSTTPSTSEPSTSSDASSTITASVKSIDSQNQNELNVFLQIDSLDDSVLSKFIKKLARK